MAENPRRAAFLELLGTEIRMFFRDRKTLLISIVLPAVLTPVLMFGSSKVMEMRVEKIAADTCRILLSGNAPDSVISAVSRAIIDGGGPVSLELTDDPDPALLDSGLVHAIVTAGVGRRPVPFVDVAYRADQDMSQAALDLVLSRLESLRDSARTAILARSGASWAPDSSLIRVEDLAPPGAREGSEFGRLAMFFVMILLLSGVSVAALDSIAGERERGSLETLLSTGLDRGVITASKLSAACAVGLMSALVQVADFALLAKLGFFEQNGGGVLPPASAFSPLLIVPVIPAAVFAAALVLFISAGASTFKEAQLKMLPALLAAAAPTLVTLFPGIGSAPAVRAVPVAGLAVSFREILSGRQDIAGMLLAALSTLSMAALLSWAAARAMSGEGIIRGSASPEPGPRMLGKRAFQVFGVIWAVNVITSMQMERLYDVRTSLLVGQLLILLAPAVYLSVKYRLPVRRVLRLRPPGPIAPLLALPCAAGGVILSSDLYRLASLALPAGERVLHDFGDTMTTGSSDPAGMLLLLCLIPGIVEEFAFRGVLMGSLAERRGWGPSGALFASALVFGMFHFLYFRIVPTAFIGLLAGMAVLRSGSLFTGMIWHASSNAFALLAARQAFDPGGLPAWGHAAAVVVVAGGLLLMGRGRFRPRSCPGRGRGWTGDRRGGKASA